MVRPDFPDPGDFAIRFLTMLMMTLALCGCSLPDMPARPPSHALGPQQTADTRLGRAVSPQAARHAGASGIHTLRDPQEAFAARMVLALMAERSLDVQYYIWRGDQTGTLLMQALVDAAERGVRVRLLLDDVGTSGLDERLAALAQHPQVQVRLFNPFVLRWPKPVGYVTDFSRANRRMHNKSFTADNQATIVGGRNVGDEYFGATEGVLFSDLDVLAIGPIVPEVSADFDRYWESASSWPVQAILPAASASALAQLAQDAEQVRATPAAHAYNEALRNTAFVTDLMAQRLPIEWSAVRMVSDDPAKGLGKVEQNGLLVDQLYQMLGAPERSLSLVSPYFVPTAAGVHALTKMRERGVAVRIMTNAYEATDVPLVHAGYAQYRKPLLQAGVDLYEMQSVALSPKGKGAWIHPLGSSGSSLHAKTFAVDGERVFVGSFNFDPRSALLNTELGFVIDSPALARSIEQAFETEVPKRAFALGLSDSGQLVWCGFGDPPVLHAVEPGSSWWSRAGLTALAWLPIEWLL